MAEYVLFRLMIAGSAAGLLVLGVGIYQGLQVMVNAHHGTQTSRHI